jgi:hypothetical protein
MCVVARDARADQRRSFRRHFIFFLCSTGPKTPAFSR